jgi:phosphate transport system permease protein
MDDPVEQVRLQEILPQHTWQDPRVILRYRRRRALGHLVAVLAVVCIVIVLSPLLDIAFMFFYRGALAISIPNLAMTSSDGGLANAIVGTLLITALAGLVAIPIGVIGGIYLAEFSGQSRYAQSIRFIADVLSGVPSILLGYISFVIFILYFGWGRGGVGSGGSLLAGAIALSVLMLPYVLRTTELSLRKVPNSLREAATALGATKAQMINRMTLILALPGILTGVILSASIAIGETAPLLITAGNSNYYSACLTSCPTSYLTYLIWNFVTSANSINGESLAYLSVFLLMSFVIGLNIIARVGLRRFSKI